MPCTVYADEVEVVPLLTGMKLPRWVLLEIASAVGGERANVAPKEPPAVIGFETWRWGTRFLSEHPELQKLGWVACGQDQVHGIRHPELRTKLVFCNTNSNTGNPSRPPKNTGEKGPANCRLIQYNSAQLSMFVEAPRDDVWYYCAHFSPISICLEVSRPDAEFGGIVTNFSDRIIVAKPGDVPGIGRAIVPQDFADVPKPKIVRKG